MKEFLSLHKKKIIKVLLQLLIAVAAAVGGYTIAELTPSEKQVELVEKVLPENPKPLEEK